MTPIPRLQLVGLSVENYRCLKQISLDFNDPMTVLIGKNASGKSTILDVFEFISEASTEMHKAISKRGNSLVDITWAREHQLDIAFRFSFNVPEHLRETLLNSLGEPSQSIKTMPNGMTVAGDLPKISTDDLRQSYFLHTLTYEVTIGNVFAEQVVLNLVLQTPAGIGPSQDAGSRNG